MSAFAMDAKGFVCEYKKRSAWFSGFEIRYIVVEDERMKVFKNEKEYVSSRRKQKTNKASITIVLRNARLKIASEQRHPHILSIQVHATHHCLSFVNKEQLLDCQNAMTAVIQRANLILPTFEQQQHTQTQSNIDLSTVNTKYRAVLTNLGLPKNKIEELVKTQSFVSKMEIVTQNQCNLPSDKSKVIQHWIKLLRRPQNVAIINITDIANLLYEEANEWMCDFINEQGLTLLVSIIPYQISNVKYQIELLQCFKAICDKTNPMTNDKIGLKYIVNDATAIQGIIDLFDSQHPQVSILIIKLLSVICWHSPDGFEKVIDGLENYCDIQSNQSMWIPIVTDLKPMIAEISNNDMVNGSRDQFAFEYVLFSMGLINAILNSFTDLEDRVSYRKDLEQLGFDKIVPYLSDLIIAMEEALYDEYEEDDSFIDDPWIDKMDEHLDLYQAVKLKDMRDSSLHGIDVSNPNDLFAFLQQHCVEDGFLNEFTRILQCLTTIPRQAPYVWTTIEKIVSYSTAPIRKQQLTHIIHQENEDDERLREDLCMLEQDPEDAFPSFEQLKVMLSRYDEDLQYMETESVHYKEQIALFKEQITNLKYQLSSQQITFEKLRGEYKKLRHKKRESQIKPKKDDFYKVVNQHKKEKKHRQRRSTSILEKMGISGIFSSRTNLTLATMDDSDEDGDVVEDHLIDIDNAWKNMTHAKSYSLNTSTTEHTPPPMKNHTPTASLTHYKPPRGYSLRSPTLTMTPTISANSLSNNASNASTPRVNDEQIGVASIGLPPPPIYEANIAQNTTQNTAQNRAQISSQNTTQNTTQNTAQNTAQICSQNTAPICAQNTAPIYAQNTAQICAQNTTQIISQNNAQNSAQISSQICSQNSAQIGTQNSVQISTQNDIKSEPENETEIVTEEPYIPPAVLLKKYLKMLKMGLPQIAVEHKMRKDKLDVDILTEYLENGGSIDPKPETETSPNNEPTPTAFEVKTAEKTTTPPTKTKSDPTPAPVKNSDDCPPKLKAYLRMIKLKIPMKNIENKMKQNGHNIQELRDYLNPPQTATNRKAKEPPPELHKYLRMIKMRIPLPVVKNKMKQDGRADNIQMLLDWLSSATAETKPAPKEPPPELARYLRMAKMKIPMAVIRNKMKQNGDADKIAMLENWVNGGGASSAKSKSTKKVVKKKKKKPDPNALPPGMKQKQKINPNKKMRALHWSTVRPKEIKNTIWDGLDDSAIDIDVTAFESLFQRKVVQQKADKHANGAAANKKEEKKQNEEIHLVDSKRSYNVDIGLSRFKLSHQQIKEAILKLDEKVLNLEKIIKLRNFIPDGNEQELLRNFDGDVTLLAHTERFFLALCNVPDLMLRMELFEFKLQFKELVVLQQDRIDTLRKSHDNVKNSESFKIVLQYILAFGNYMNGGTAKGQAFGFKLNSLRQIVSAKSVDNKMTLLHYLYLEIDKKDKSALQFVKDFEVLADGSRLDISQLSAEVSKIGGSINKIRKKLADYNKKDQKSPRAVLSPSSKLDFFDKKMSLFLAEAEPHYNKLKKGHDSAKSDCTKLAEFFNCRNDIKFEFFKDLYAFSQSFQRIGLEIEKKRAREAKQLKSIQMKAKRQERLNKKRELNANSHSNGTKSPNLKSKGHHRRTSSNQANQLYSKKNLNKKRASVKKNGSPAIDPQFAAIMNRQRNNNKTNRAGSQSYAQRRQSRNKRKAKSPRKSPISPKGFSNSSSPNPASSPSSPHFTMNGLPPPPPQLDEVFDDENVSPNIQITESVIKDIKLSAVENRRKASSQSGRNKNRTGTPKKKKSRWPGFR